MILAKHRILSIVCLFIFLLPTVIHAQVSGISISNLQIVYEPFSGLPASSGLRVSLALSDPSDSDIDEQTGTEEIRLRIRPTNNTAFVATNTTKTILPITFTSNTRGARLSLFNNEYHHDFTLRGSSGRSLSLDYLASIPASIFAVSGLYNLSLEVDLLDLSTGVPLTSTEVVDLQVLVKSKLQVNIAGARSAAVNGVKLTTIEFDELTTDESSRVFIQVRGNTPALITVSSENSGRLLLRDSEDIYIDYKVSVDGEVSNLERPLKLRRLLAQDLRGTAYPMTLTVGQVEGAFSGSYQDILTVEVRPQ